MVVLQKKIANNPRLLPKCCLLSGIVKTPLCVAQETNNLMKLTFCSLPILWVLFTGKSFQLIWQMHSRWFFFHYLPSRAGGRVKSWFDFVNSSCEWFSVNTPCGPCLAVSQLKHTWLKRSLIVCKPADEPCVWIRCAGAERPLQHAETPDWKALTR